MDINKWITYKAKYRWLWEMIGEGEWSKWYKEWLQFRNILKEI